MKAAIKTAPDTSVFGAERARLGRSNLRYQPTRIGPALSCPQELLLEGGRIRPYPTISE